MLYLIILADGRLRQVEQLTDELLAEYMAGRLEIIQVPIASDSVLSELADVQGDVLEWSTVTKGGSPVSTEQEAIRVIEDVACRTGAKLTDGLEADLGLDSLDQIELVMALEENFDIDITDEKALEVRTVKDVVELVEDLANRGTDL